MLSPVVATKIVVRIRNRSDTRKPSGRFCVIASNAAGKLKPSNAAETEPGASKLEGDAGATDDGEPEVGHDAGQ